MEKDFKINVYFDEKSENVEKLIVDYLLNKLKKEK